MTNKPSSCNGCPLETLSTGYMIPTLSRSHNGVALMGEALGEHEADQGAPFVGPAGFRLTRLIEWAGFKREDFDIFNAVWCRPPDNKLEGQPYEFGAINHCRSSNWGSAVMGRSRVIVPMGNVPLGALTGRKGILKTRGYLRQSRDSAQLIIPTVHPSYIQRGQSRYSAAVINDLQKAVYASLYGVPPQVYDYTLDPSPLEALRWAQDYRGRLMNDPSIHLAYDIETPYKGDDEEEAGDDDDDDYDITETILRIGFSYNPYTALSIPFNGAYRAAIELCLGSSGPKVVWNNSFDTPRLRRNGVGINGLIHDGMVAWHVLHSDLPKGLGFVATFTCWWQEEWKHLNSSRPAFYNATDADVELRSWEAILKDLKASRLWEVYERDVVQLEPILEFMSAQGMPVDPEVRLDRAIKLANKRQELVALFGTLIPLEARKIEHVYKNPPKETTGLCNRPGVGVEVYCSGCGLTGVRKAHFKRYVKKVNPCADAAPMEREVGVVEWFRLGAWTPSRDQLIRYNNHLNRPTPTKWDAKTRTKKVSTNNKSLKELIRKYPDDLLYPIVLEYRIIDKISGTYIGKVVEVA